MDIIKINKYLLSLFSPSLSTLLTACISPTLLLPDCSTSTLQHLVNIITTGYTVTEGMSLEEMNEITEAAQLLSVDMKDLRHGRSERKVQQKNGGKFHKNKPKNSTDLAQLGNEQQQESVFVFFG